MQEIKIVCLLTKVIQEKVLTVSAFDGVWQGQQSSCCILCGAGLWSKKIIKSLQLKFSYYQEWYSQLCYIIIIIIIINIKDNCYHYHLYSFNIESNKIYNNYFIIVDTFVVNNNYQYIITYYAYLGVVISIGRETTQPSAKLIHIHRNFSILPLKNIQLVLNHGCGS